MTMVLPDFDQDAPEEKSEILFQKQLNLFSKYIS